MYCKINGSRINFYEEIKGKGIKLISKDDCIDIMKQKIKKYVKSKGCSINLLTKQQLKILLKKNKNGEPYLLNKICEQDQEGVVVATLEGDIDDIINHNKPNIFIYALIKKGNIISISSIYKEYKELNIKGAFFSASCSVKQEPKIIFQPNYFLRAFSILELLENNKFDIIWGVMGGDLKFLAEYHKGRGCDVDIEGRPPIYKCEIVNFLNKFFEWLEELINSE